MSNMTSLWQVTSPPSATGGALSGSLRTSVAIVGGGAVGAACALHLAEMGIDAILLDAGGETGREVASIASGGLVAPQLVRGTPSSIIERFGEEVGGAFLHMIATSGTYTFDLIRRLGLDCAAQDQGFIAPFRASQRAATEKSFGEWEALRNDLHLADAVETARLTGCIGYDGALVDRSGGAVNPLAFAREMGRVAASLGARLFGHSPVTAIARTAGGYSLQTSRGEVIAAKVIFAANGGNMALHPALARTVLPLQVREVATVPLAADLRAAILAEGHAMTDRGPDIFTIRYDIDGRLITAATQPWSRQGVALEKAVNARLQRMIPAWRYTPLDHAWTGTAWLNADLQPRIVPLSRDMLAVQACNGRGIATAAPIGRSIAQWIADPATILGLPVITPSAVAGYGFARRVPNFALGLAAIKSRLPF